MQNTFWGPRSGTQKLFCLVRFISDSHFLHIVYILYMFRICFNIFWYISVEKERPLPLPLPVQINFDGFEYHILMANTNNIPILYGLDGPGPAPQMAPPALGQGRGQGPLQSMCSWYIISTGTGTCHINPFTSIQICYSNPLKLI